MSNIFQKIPFLRLAVALVIGIIAALFVYIPVTISLVIFGLILAALVAFNKYYNYRLTNIFGVGIHLLFFMLGIMVYINHNHKPEFYDKGAFVATVLETPVEKPNSYKSVLKLKLVNENDTFFYSEETVLAYFEKHKNVVKLKPGDIIIFKNTPIVVTNKKNPFEFNYKAYLKKQKIYRQIFILTTDWTLTNLQHPFSLKIFAEKTRMKLLDIYREQNLDKNELDILSALTLGYKQELDPETKRVFSSAGAMHVLAVSGLHVGIIFWILLQIFGFLRKRNAGRFVFVTIVISILWFFAFLTGLSPSVSRAATMFTFVVIGTNINRRVNIYNSLTGSALFILLINPNNLFEVGFQLSYAAVFGIIFLQPKIEKLVSIKYKFINFFWQLLTVSIAAQIATFPISILYFNQFPTYFWISNLFVIPAVMILIPLGFSLLIFHAIPFIGNTISISTDSIIKFVYHMLKSVENLPFSVQEISISNVEFVCVIGLLISLFLLIHHFQFKYLKSSLLFIFLIFGVSLANKINALFQKEIIVYNDDELIVHLISGKNNYVITDNGFDDTDYSFNLINNTKRKLNLKEPIFLKLSDKYQDESMVMEKNMVFFDRKTLLIKKEINDFSDRFSLDIIVNPKNLDELPDSIVLNNLVVTEEYNIDQTSSNLQIYNPYKKGAFIEKW